MLARRQRSNLATVKTASAIALVALLATGCQCESESEASTHSTPAPGAPSSAAVAVDRAGPTPIPASDRVVGIGDLHGDLQAARDALELAGAIDAENDWIGGKLVVVQTGDQLDRGDDEPEIVALFDALAEKARAKGGAVISLNGNHEVMNVQGDFRYVTGEGFSDFASYAGSARDPAELMRVPSSARGRAVAFFPGGPLALRLAERPITAIVGDTLFVHGGVLPAHASYGLARANEQTRAWMRGELAALPPILDGDQAPIWTRAYGDVVVPDSACETLSSVLAGLKVERMVVGHTVMKDGISSACNERVWRIDVGLSKHYGGATAVLEIQGDRVRAITARDE
jgi:hypothetical protein